MCVSTHTLTGTCTRAHPPTPTVTKTQRVYLSRWLLAGAGVRHPISAPSSCPDGCHFWSFPRGRFCSVSVSASVCESSSGTAGSLTLSRRTTRTCAACPSCVVGCVSRRPGRQDAEAPALCPRSSPSCGLRAGWGGSWAPRGTDGSRAPEPWRVERGLSCFHPVAAQKVTETILRRLFSPRNISEKLPPAVRGESPPSGCRGDVRVAHGYCRPPR